MQDVMDADKKDDGQAEQVRGEFDESDLYVIKLPNVLKPYFSEFFDQLDESELQKRLNIDTYNVRVTSLEEVFNTLGQQENAKESENIINDNKVDDKQSLLDGGLQTSKLSFMEIVKIILKNRIMVLLRQKAYFYQWIWPVAFLFGMLFITIENSSFKPNQFITLTRIQSLYNSSNIGAYDYGKQDGFGSNATLNPTLLFNSNSFIQQDQSILKSNLIA